MTVEPWTTHQREEIHLEVPTVSFWERVELRPAALVAITQDNITRSWAFAPIVAAVMTLFLSLDQAAVHQHLAQSPGGAQLAEPWLWWTRLATILTCAVWIARIRGREVGVNNAPRLLQEFALFMGALMAEVGLLLGLYEWFHPSIAYYVAGLFFVSVVCVLPTTLAGLVFAMGLAGVLPPLLFGPMPVDWGTVVNLVLMSLLGLVTNRVLYVLNANALLNIAAVTLQRDTLERMYRDLQRAYEDAERSRALAHEAAQARARFLAHMSHEVRSPVHGIMGLTQLAIDEGLPPQHEVRARTVLGTAKTLLAVVNNVLDFSKAEAGAITYEREPVDVNLAIREVLLALTPLAKPKGVELKSDLDSPVVLGDDTRLRQILFNLVGNAIKFTEQGEVRVISSFRDGLLVIEVHDTGIGVAPERLKAVFRPFEQADSATARRYGGTGLGLAIVSRMVHDQGGTVAAGSELGKGSSFAVRLPTEVANLEPKVLPPRTSTIPPEDLRALVVDDTPVSRMLLKGLLNSLGHDVVCAESGEEALKILQTERFGIVFVDVEMPGMTGLEMASLLRQSSGKNRRVPIVAVTGHGRDEVQEAMAAAGVEHHLMKPFAMGALVTALNEALPN